MAETFVNVTEGSGKKLHANDRTIGANTVLDEYMLPGEYPLATYTVYAAGVSSATAAAHVLQVMAGASLNLRIRRIRAVELTATAGTVRLEIVRLTTAGTGGTAVTARPLDTADAAAGAAGMTLPTVKGTEGSFIGSLVVGTYTAVGAAFWQEWRPALNSKSLVVPAGTANGIALKTSGLAATAVDVEIELVETSFV